ncbi:peroxiredoxin-5, mitochondrial-like [Octopus vulgaris]|uniref:Peroxiredoxin-5, mitochondrial n=1 Tax=Octopus vulgaris TaxID=6645 RepID=A0AA36BJC5_OCTVU|nr:peroxiredoxin-5, mitochondrial-like [Octopus vulgaris]
MMALKCMFPLSKLNGNTTGRYFLRSIKLQVGSQLPEIMLFERINNSVESVNISELYRSKKGVLFSVVGAFTPGCSNAHIPEYINHYQAFRKAGYDLIACVSVNDPFVMSAWCRQTKSEGKVRKKLEFNVFLYFTIQLAELLAYRAKCLAEFRLSLHSEFKFHQG